MKRVGHAARIGEKRGAYRVLVGKLEGRRNLGRSRRRREDFKMDLQETGWMTWTVYGSGYGQMEGSYDHGNEHSVSIKRGKILD
jgi:hypothetical protein